MDTTAKKYYKARREAYEEYYDNTKGTSEYMEQDFMEGFDYGYNAAMMENAEERQLREQAAIAAMQGMLANGGVTCSPDHIAQRSVAFADALINELNTPKQ